MSNHHQQNQIIRQGPVINHGLFEAAFNQIKNSASFDIRVTGEGRALNQESGVWEPYSSGIEIRGDSEEVARERIEKQTQLEIEEIDYEYQLKAAEENKNFIMEKANLDGWYMQRLAEIEAQADLYKEQLRIELEKLQSTIEHDIEKSNLNRDANIEKMQIETKMQVKANELQVSLDKINTQRQIQTRELNAQKEIDLAKISIVRQLADIENAKRIQLSKEAENYNRIINDLECNFRVRAAQLESQKQIAIAKKRNGRKFLGIF